MTADTVRTFSERWIINAGIRSRTTGMSNIKQSLTPNTEQCETNLTKHAKNPKPIWREIKQVEFCVENYFGNILKIRHTPFSVVFILGNAV